MIATITASLACIIAIIAVVREQRLERRFFSVFKESESMDKKLQQAIEDALITAGWTPPRQDHPDLEFGENTGLLVKPAEHGGLVVLLPPSIRADAVSLVGPKRTLDLENTGLANPVHTHEGELERQHWRLRNEDPSKLNKKIGRVGKVKLRVQLGSTNYEVVLPARFDERME